MTPKTVAWIKLISLATGTGCAAAGAAYGGGAKVLVCVVIGVGVAATNVYHALGTSPNDPQAPK